MQNQRSVPRIVSHKVLVFSGWIVYVYCLSDATNFCLILCYVHKNKNKCLCISLNVLYSFRSLSTCCMASQSHIVNLRFGIAVFDHTVRNSPCGYTSRFCCEIVRLNVDWINWEYAELYRYLRQKNCYLQRKIKERMNCKY